MAKSVSVAVASILGTTIVLGAVHILHADTVSFAPGETLSAAKMNDGFSTLSNRLAALEHANANAAATPLVVAGTIAAFGGPNAPDGWLLCDGIALDRVAEPTLFAAIGTAWGAPDATKFNLPDLRGLFLRGVDGAAGRDPDGANRAPSHPGGNAANAVGSVEGDTFLVHSHTQFYYSARGIGYDPGGAFANVLDVGTTLETAPNGGPETRPKNAAVNYIIKR